MDLHIRYATPADAESITAYNAAMAKETENLELDRERLLAGVRKLLADPGKGYYFLAESGGRIVGQTMITFEWSDWRNGAFWWIQSVYVEPSARKRGVFRALFQHISEETRRAGGAGLRLYVERHNRLAQGAYTRLGMRPASYEIYELDFILDRNRHRI